MRYSRKKRMVTSHEAAIRSFFSIHGVCIFLYNNIGTFRRNFIAFLSSDQKDPAKNREQKIESFQKAALRVWLFGYSFRPRQKAGSFPAVAEHVHGSRTEAPEEDEGEVAGSVLDEIHMALTTELLMAATL